VKVARLFIAVWPPDGVVSELTGLHRKDQRGVRFVPPDNWHITLRFLGEADPDEVIEALDGAELPSARARLGPAVDVLADRALVVPVSGVNELAEAVTRLTANIGKPTRHRFFGHLTLARLKPYAAMPRTLASMVSAEFDVDEIALVQSRLDPEGARYETLEAWPLP
jgi:RNA 2',3'-cyclic 3'-phosphodiesterase